MKSRKYFRHGRFNGVSNSAAQTKGRHPALRAAIEGLEGRVLFSVDFVTSAADSGLGTLRHAIAAASSGDTIEFDTAAMGTNTIDLNAGAGTIVIASKNLTIGDSTTAGQNIIIDGTGNSGANGIFELTGASSVSFTNLTIQNGTQTSGNVAGGAVEAAGTGTLTLANDTFFNNSITTSSNAAEGGAVFNGNGSTLNVQGCLFLTNTATSTGTNLSVSVGGAIYNNGTLTVIESTFDNNSASNPGNNSTKASGGAVFNDTSGTASFTFCTITANSATTAGTAANDGGGIFNAHNGASLILTSTILASNTDTAGAHFSLNASALFSSGGHNLVGSDISAGGTDVNSDAPGLAPLGYYGGPTQTLAMKTTSPAFETGGSFNTTDQRGFSANVANADIGAFQSQALPTGETSAFTVNSNADFVSSAAVGGTPSGTQGLRGAIDLGEIAGGVGTPDAAISLAASLIGTTITLGETELDITDDLTITGPAAGVTISGNNAAEVFKVDSGVTANLSGLTIANGKATDGGGILNNGTLVVSNDTLTSNAASNSGGAICNNSVLTVLDSTISNNSSGNIAGGIYGNNGSTLNVSGSTFSDNSVIGYGGGLMVTNASATITNSTFSGNSATLSGGAIEDTGSVTVLDCTLSGNSAGPTGGGGAIDNFDGGYTLKIGDSILAGNLNVNAPDVANSVTSLGHNLVGQTTQSSGWVASDLTGTTTPLNPLLAPLGNYGGPTKTFALLPGSPAIGAGTPAPITSSSNAVGAGSATVSPGSMSNIIAGEKLIIDAGLSDQEVVTVTSVTATTFHATFAKAHAPGFTITTSNGDDQRGDIRSLTAPSIGAYESEGFTISATGGGGQSKRTGSAFATALGVKVSSNNLLLTDLAGGIITFTAPSQTGASATFSQNPITLAANGTGSTTATANGIVGGPYNVTASATGIATAASYSLTNLSPATTTTASTANATYNTSSQTVTLSATISSPGGTVNEGTVTFAIFNGTTQIGSAVTSGTVAGGTATASYTLPGGTDPAIYTIHATYNPGADFNSSSDNTHTLTVSAATPVITVTSPNPASIIYHTASATFAGKIAAGSLIPTGSVAITLNGVTQHATISSTDGTFSSIFNTASLPIGSYTVGYAYSANGNFNAASASSTLNVTYNVNVLFNSTINYRAGTTIPITIGLTNAAGQAIPSKTTNVTAIGIANMNTPTTILPVPNSSPSQNVFGANSNHDQFRLVLNTMGVAPATYLLYFTISGDPVTHSVTLILIK